MNNVDVYNTIFINGKPFKCINTMSLKDLLIYLGFNIDLIVVEYNKKVISSIVFNQIFLNHHDCLEVITIAGGG
uniref:Conserved hypothetical plastid protein Ycf40 n=1 Tax=Gastroclonium compressum TaxID=1852973 RepID=A0A173G0B3_GASCM|nr:conserved hypothetical plastid protein Ycf40 [Coeloseira compressa]ANH09707.1 conserved hypothetical plastid protein Ycf40 [Coeloseira compressa]